ncbi:MAG TPA: hypothetical protein GXZ58_08935 [Bacilli bacterium]|nr:hypothetical protein [Bacilli bacterium]
MLRKVTQVILTLMIVTGLSVAQLDFTPSVEAASDPEHGEIFSDPEHGEIFGDPEHGEIFRDPGRVGILSDPEHGEIF